MENEPTKSIAEAFAGLSDKALMRRMERSADFGYDDLEHELTRRLRLGGQAWRWATIDGRDRVEVYTPEDGR